LLFLKLSSEILRCSAPSILVESVFYKYFGATHLVPTKAKQCSRVVFVVFYKYYGNIYLLPVKGKRQSRVIFVEMHLRNKIKGAEHRNIIFSH